MLSPRRLAVLITLFDLVWCLQALSQRPSHATSTVSVASLVLWIYLHLPAALLASLLLKPWISLEGGPSAALPWGALAIFAVLGLLQTYGLAYGLARWRQGRRP